MRRNRLERAKSIWSYSWDSRPEWLIEAALRWRKLNPFTACSCEWCQYPSRVEAKAPDVSEWE